MGQDQEKSEALKTQMKDLEGIIEATEMKIMQMETTLKELRKLQDQISTHTTARSTLFKLQQTQYAALAEENEGIQYALDEFTNQFLHCIVY
jgi:DNA repair protein RAD50